MLLINDNLEITAKNLILKIKNAKNCSCKMQLDSRKKGC